MVYRKQFVRTLDSHFLDVIPTSFHVLNVLNIVSLIMFPMTRAETMNAYLLLFFVL